MWNRVARRCGVTGRALLTRSDPGRRFPFPKSLYAVEDALRFFVGDKPDAVILDFFAGSGTTAHAVDAAEQAGRRPPAVDLGHEQRGVRGRAAGAPQEGLRPGDPEWERWASASTSPSRASTAAITGKTPDGEPIKGDYKFTDEFPMADGFEENVEFFTLTYEAPLPSRHNREFARIAPLLWLRAGSEGRRIDDMGERAGTSPTPTACSPTWITPRRSSRQSSQS